MATCLGKSKHQLSATLYDLGEEVEFDGHRSRYAVVSVGLETILGDDNVAVFLTDKDGRPLSWQNAADYGSWDAEIPAWADKLHTEHWTKA